MTNAITFLVVVVVVIMLATIATFAISTPIEQLTLAYAASTIEIPTYDPPMTHPTEGAKLNGTKMLDYTGSEDIASVMVPWYNLTVFVDVTDYNDCLGKVDADIQAGPKALTVLTNNATETQRVLLLPPDEQKEFAMDHCLGVLHISNAMEEFGAAFSEALQ